MTGIKPSAEANKRIVEFSEEFVVDRKTIVEIPRDYQALVFSNEKIQFKINPTAKYEIGKQNKDYLKSTCKIAFIKTSDSAHLWGYGFNFEDVPTKTTYDVKVSGEYRFKITDAPQLIKQWSNGDVLVSDMHEKVLLKAVQQTVGKVVKDKILRGVGKLEIANESTQEMLDFLLTLDSLKRYGVEVSDVIIENLSWDMKTETPSPAPVPAPTPAPQTVAVEKKPEQDVELSRIEELLNKTIQNLARQIDKNMKEQLELSKEMLAAARDEKIQESLPLHEAAREENIKDLKLTTRALIELASPDDDYVAPAALIYSNVEENLIRMGLMHKGHDFVMDYNEYIELANTVKDGEYFLFMHKDPDTGELEPNAVNAFEVDERGRPILIKMFPALRFIKAGMEPCAVQEASTRWSFLNKIRHKNSENVFHIETFLRTNNTTKKAYLLGTLDFFIKYGLYTRDK